MFHGPFSARRSQRPTAQRRCLTHGLERIPEINARHRSAHGVVIGKNFRGLVRVGAASDKSQQSDVVDGGHSFAVEPEVGREPCGNEGVAQAFLDREVVASIAGERESGEQLVEADRCLRLAHERCPAP